MSPSRITEPADPNLPTRFSILLPVYRPPAMLPYAIETVLAQTLMDFELLVISDGAPEDTIACARTYAARDPRVKVLPFPKGAACGEAHRHVALANACGANIAHIADDDLWFPNHLEELEKLLREVDFGHLLHVNVNGNGSFQILPSDLASVRLRQRILTETYNVLGDSVTGYRLAAYRRLPEGWAPPPTPEHPDLKMWRKFLRLNELRFGTRMSVTALIFPADIRRHMSLEERAQEIREWHARILDPANREIIVQEAWRSLMLDFMQMEDDRRARLLVIETMNAQIAALRSINHIRPTPSSEINFSELGNSFLYTVSGWSFPEAGFRWTDGAKASIRVPSPPTVNGTEWGSHVLRLRASAFDGPQRVVVVVDGERIAELTIDALRDHDVNFRLSHSANPADHEIMFELPDAHSPASIGKSPDERKLGIAVVCVTFLPAQDS